MAGFLIQHKQIRISITNLISLGRWFRAGHRAVSCLRISITNLISLGRLGICVSAIELFKDLNHESDILATGSRHRAHKRGGCLRISITNLISSTRTVTNICPINSSCLRISITNLISLCTRNGLSSPIGTVV